MSVIILGVAEKQRSYGLRKNGSAVENHEGMVISFKVQRQTVN